MSNIDEDCNEDTSVIQVEEALIEKSGTKTARLYDRDLGIVCYVYNKNSECTAMSCIKLSKEDIKEKESREAARELKE